MAEASTDESERATTRARMARALADAGFTGVRVISWETARPLLTDRRLELLRTIERDEPESVRALARRLDRDKGAVSRDLATLCEAGVVSYEAHGRAKRPVLAQDHLVVEPIV